MKKFLFLFIPFLSCIMPVYEKAEINKGAWGAIGISGSVYEDEGQFKSFLLHSLHIQYGISRQFALTASASVSPYSKFEKFDIEGYIMEISGGLKVNPGEASNFAVKIELSYPGAYLLTFLYDFKEGQETPITGGIQIRNHLSPFLVYHFGYFNFFFGINSNSPLRSVSLGLGISMDIDLETK